MNTELLPPITLNFYTDSGHGWLQVPRALFETHKVKISAYSYEDKNSVYLEEDLDAPRFTSELEKFYRIVVKHVYLDDYPCYIRQLPRSNVRAYL